MQSGRENKELIHCVGQKTSWKQTTSETKVQVAKITDKYLVTTGFTQNRTEQNRTEQRLIIDVLVQESSEFLDDSQKYLAGLVVRSVNYPSFIQGGPKVGLQYIVYTIYCIPTFGPPCV